MTFTVQIDAEGRIQLPLELRDALHLEQGDQLSLQQEENDPQRVVLSARSEETHLVWREGIPVIVGLPPISASQTLHAIDQVREGAVLSASDDTTGEED